MSEVLVKDETNNHEEVRLADSAQIQTVEVTVPVTLRINCRIGDGVLYKVTANEQLRAEETAGRDVVEKIPYIVRDYSDRSGYDPDFLGVRLNIPEANTRVAAKMDNGDYVIPYEHFSIVMNAKRKMALFTISNVDGNKRRPEPGDYSRGGLGELNGQSETWIQDSRLSSDYQLTDAFYTKDRSSFDKGHVVRREDVCWGDSLAQIKKANGDTFHLTNCTPQVSDFNRADQGGIWGKLENLVLEQAKQERAKYSLLAGPVLNRRDSYFEGWSRDGIIRVQIPQEYWKIVVFESEGTLHAYAFVLEQSLKHVQWEAEAEFEVTAEWDPFLISLTDLQIKLGDSIRFPQELIDADRSTSTVATSLLETTELRRFS